MTIAILNETVGIKCLEGHCINESKIYFSVIYILMFIANTKDTFYPKIQIWWRRRSENSKKNS